MAFYDARQGVQKPQLNDIDMFGAVQKGQVMRKGILEDYLARKKDEQATQVQQLGQQYATAEPEQRAMLSGQMNAINPEYTKTFLGNQNVGVNPFEGTSMEAQKANLQYQRYKAAGYSDSEARINAINDAAATGASFYNDALGNRVTQGGIPLPNVGGSPVLSGNQAPTSPQIQPMLGGGQPVQPTQSIMDNIAQASPEEKAFTTQFTSLPPEKRAAFYKEQAINHPDLPDELTPDLEAQLLDIGAALKEVDGVVLPKPIDRLSPTPEEMNSPLARKLILEKSINNKYDKEKQVPADYAEKFNERLAMDIGEDLSELPEADLKLIRNTAAQKMRQGLDFENAYMTTLDELGLQENEGAGFNDYELANKSQKTGGKTQNQREAKQSGYTAQDVQGIKNLTSELEKVNAELKKMGR